MPDLPARQQLILIATDPNAWPYQEQIEALLDAYRDQVLTEAAEILHEHAADCCAGEHVDAHVQLLLAARTGQEA